MIKRLVLIATIGYIIGIIYGLYFTKISIALFFIAILTTIILSIFLNRKVKRYLKVILPRKAILIFIIFIIIGFTYISILNKKYDNIYQIDREIEVDGIIEAVEIKEYSNKYILKVKSIDNKKYANIKLILYTKRKGKLLEYGDYIKLIAQYEEPQESRNYKGFSYKNYLKQNGIYGTVQSVGEIQVIEKSKINPLGKFVNNIKGGIINQAKLNLSENAKAVFLGILLGEKQEIPEDISNSFRKSNMAHILAVSGAHVSYIMLIISVILGKHKKRFYLISTIIILIFFMMLTNFTPSVVRACIMAIIALFSKLIHEKSDIYNNLSLSAFLILLNNPYTILNIGFQLTYLGTLGIVLLSSNINIWVNVKNENKEHKHSKLYLKNIIKHKLKKRITNLIIISISVQILIMPIILINFNTISYNFLISGIIATPIFAGIMMVGVFALMPLPLRNLSFFCLEILVNSLIFISEILSNLPLSTITIKTPNITYIISYYIILTAILLSRSKIILRIMKKEVILSILKKFIAIVLIFCLIVQFFKIFNNRDLKIYFIDVGQGDSTLIVTPKNKVILIDGGGSYDESYDVGKNVLVPYLLDRGIQKIDYIIVSHFDNDHVRRYFNGYEGFKGKKCCNW